MARIAPMRTLRSGEGSDMYYTFKDILFSERLCHACLMARVATTKPGLLFDVQAWFTKDETTCDNCGKQIGENGVAE